MTFQSERKKLFWIKFNWNGDDDDDDDSGECEILHSVIALKEKIGR